VITATTRPDVLVVDDDEDIRTSVQEMLDDEGYSSISVANGRRALDVLETYQEAPRVILLDLMMPVMDGWEFLARVNREKRLRRIPIVIMSAHPSVRDACAGGPKPSLQSLLLLAKPFDARRLLAAIEGAVPTRAV